MEERAAASGHNPVASRLRHMEDARARAVIAAAAERDGDRSCSAALNRAITARDVMEIRP